MARAAIPAGPGAVPVNLWQIRWRLWRRGFLENFQVFWASRIGPLGLGIIIFFALFALAHPILMATVWPASVYDPVVGYDPMILHPSPPTRGHLLGTDPYGRDILSQLMYSTRWEFVLGVISAAISVVIGTTVGTVAAYFGGWVDTLFMRLADLLLLFPFIAFLLVLGALFEIDLFDLAIIIGLLSGFGGITIIIRAQALSVAVRPYVEAARLAGGSPWWVIRKHIIPNVMPLSFLYMMFNVTSAILSEATLSFFGLLNVRSSWGLMINTAESAGYLLMFDQYWWLWLPAGLAITLLCAAFYLVGRGLDEVVNPRLRKR
ncbi:ABC transporter permease [Geochorda subterranea]|uniref:ABC transporter permease n=1 Tax=Geochorda subterranea TaxID=3109564 RepID=A0ABZ1BRZ1_9FIRM|nr:ABC transporter permease [Limnochorda sp. LNt]WRP15464.1 ABC transporter permease [Limnochorda sp. LNt]